MNSKFLYAATVAVSLISTYAVADANPLTRAQVNAELQQARADGTLQRTDYDNGDTRPQIAASTTTRAQVGAERARDAAARKALVGPYANERYNPYGAEIFETSTLARSEVKNDVLQAAANGTLQRTDYDDATLVARRAHQHEAASTFAQRMKARFAKDHG
jgi:Domain of unknown function (DUF4148)